MSRVANGRLNDLTADQLPAGSLVPFLCECSDEACLGRIELDSGDYTGLHVDRDQYIVLLGHPIVEGEEVVEKRGDTFAVMRKP